MEITWKEKQHEQTRQLTTPKARHGHDYLPSTQACAESACMVGKEKQKTRRNIMTVIEEKLKSLDSEKELSEEEVEEKIKDLEADLYETIPFKRSQAHVHGDDQAWIDKWEKEVEAELGYRKGYLASIMSTKREIQTLTKTSEGA